MPYYLKERLQNYTDPWRPLAYYYWFLLQNLTNSWRGIRSRTFATWFSNLSPHFVRFEEETAVPRLVGLASGTVLELGPGSGNQLPRFDRRAITRIYGVEPNRQLFDQLRNEAIEQHSLGDIYVPIHAALEDTELLEEKWGIGAESIDTIVCIGVLCSISDLAGAARQMYRLLKPGGQLLFWEHQASKDPVTRVVQRLWNFLWTPAIGNCSFSRETERALIKAGDWEIAELGNDDEQPWRLQARFWGRFVKSQPGKAI